MLPRILVVALGLVALADPAAAQGSNRFCHQYASIISDIAGDAIKKNPACQDFSKGVHANYQMHYSWCVRQRRSEVEGADQNIRRLIDLCTRPARSQNVDPLGRVWDENEVGWRGNWQRIGNSNAFKATWTHPTAGVVRADLAITANGSQVTVIRRDTFGPGVGKGCLYTGTLQGNAVSGQYTCDWDRGRMNQWSARIN